MGDSEDYLSLSNDVREYCSGTVRCASYRFVDLEVPEFFKKLMNVNFIQWLLIKRKYNKVAKEYCGGDRFTGT